MPFLSRSFIITVSILLCIGLVSAAYFQFTGSAGSSQNPGEFRIDNTGNAGIVTFDRSAGLDGSILTGTFTIQTIGKIVFEPNTRIIPPSSGKVTDLWSVSGTAMSIYAGIISLDHVYYDPIKKKLAGHGYNYGIGRIPFGDAVIIDPITQKPTIQENTNPQDASITSTANIGFEGRVKVLGTIGGASAFATFYSPGTRFNAATYNIALNQVRKNIALLTRNLTISSDQKIVNNTIFIKGNKKYSEVESYFPSTTVDSLVILGGDLVIDKDILNIDTIKPKGIIVMKNGAGQGGNIIIQGVVQRIQSSIFTEGTVYSGTGMDSGIYNDTAEKILTLPENQLYIQGSLISRNTIGGATQSSPLCVYGETSCTFTQAIKYDLNYFRATPVTRSNSAPTTRSYLDDTLDTYSLIIERDSRISELPPPGWVLK